jgi:hypothetical protein
VYSEAIILLEQGIPETQVPSTMPQGKAIDVRDRQFVVRLKDYFDQKRHHGRVRRVEPPGPDRIVIKVQIWHSFVFSADFPSRLENQ